jgi:hypothetical protein
LSRKSFAPRKSALDDFRDVIGVISDKEVAAKAGISTENVRTYRLRRGIPAAWRGESLEALQAKQKRRAAKKVETRPRRPKKRKMRRRRSSKLDPYLELLGDVSDRDLADRAGVTPENVRAYRVRRGIPARWRGEGAGDAGAEGFETSPAAAARRGSSPAAKSDAVSYAYRVVAEVAGEDREYVVFAADMAEAAARAGEKLLRLHPHALMRELSLVGEAL